MKYLLFCLLPLGIFAQNRVYDVAIDNSKPKHLQVDQLDLHVDLDFDAPQGKVLGKVIIRMVPIIGKIDSLWLDGPGISVSEALVNQEEIPFKTYKKGLALYPKKAWKLKDTLMVELTYEAWPKRGMYFLGWNDSTNTSPKQIWTQGQGIDNRHWVPHVDAQNDKLITSISAIVDPGYSVISNGRLVDKVVLGEKVKWNYKMEKPHSSYLMMLAVGRYKSKTEYLMGTEVVNYYYPEWESRYEFTYYKNKEIFTFLSKEIGVPYPWQNYKQVPVMNFQHGAMENTSATIYGDFFCVDSASFNDENYVRVNAHELAHQWFGDLITSPSSKDHWLHEGFATYYAWLAEREVFGKERFAFLRRQSLERIDAAEEKDMYPLAHGKAGSERFYDKGAWVLHMLRKEMGDAKWKEAVANFVEENKFGMVETEQMRDSFEKSSNSDLQWFFDQWVYRSQIPNLTLNVTENNGVVKVEVSQNLLKDQPPFKITVPLKLVTSRRTMDAVFSMETERWSHSFRMPAGENIVAVLPDPNFDLLAVWNTKGDIKLLENMSSFEKNDWYGATKGLVSHPEYNPAIAIKMADAQLLNRLEYARLLGQKSSAGEKLSADEVLFIKYERNLEVIRTFLSSTSTIQEDLLVKLEDWLELPSYEIKEKALVLLCLNDIENASNYLQILDGVQGTRGHNVRVTWLLLHNKLNGNDKIEELASFTAPKYDFLTRINAFQSLQILNYLNDEIVENALSGVFQGNRKLRNSSRGFVKTMIQEKSNRKIFESWLKDHESKFTAEQLKVIEKLFEKA